ncbi:MAG: DUF4142 domain-containing protein [Candidatus Eremiobacteraeota bacterium]|nr:DUF4142 domain-containing protein [Candidatus Eremiobacteraeota bacterium]
MNRTSKHSPHARRALAALIAVAGFGAATLAVTAQPSPEPTPPGGGMPDSEAGFVLQLGRSNNAELDEAKYVVNRTQDPAVHTFAQRMIDDHSSAAVKLQAATRGTNTFPAPSTYAESAFGRAAMRMLTQQSGGALDSLYMRIQVPAHQRMLALLTWETQNGQTATLKALATQLVPVARDHLQMAQQYLSAHNLTPYTVPLGSSTGGQESGSPDRMTPNGTTPNNPATGGSGSTSGQNSGGSQPAQPYPGSTPAVPMGSGTVAPSATTAPNPMPTRT